MKKGPRRFFETLTQNTSNDTINIAKIIIVAFWVWRQKSKPTKTPKKHTFQVINGLLKLGYWSLSELSTSLSLYYRDRFRSQSNTWCGNLCKLSWCEPKTPDGALWNCTSFSLSVRTLISSSYLSSFCEYCGSKTTTAIRNRKHVRWDKYFHCIYRNEFKKKNRSEEALLRPIHQVCRGAARVWQHAVAWKGGTYLLSLCLQWLQVVGHSFQLFLKLRAFAGVLGDKVAKDE